MSFLLRLTRPSEFGYDGKTKIGKSNLSANLVSVMQAGAVVGALVAFPCADKWGRKPSLIGVSIFAFIGGLLQAFSYGHLSCFYIGRSVQTPRVSMLDSRPDQIR